jgi:aminopeptidase-like protein
MTQQARIETSGVDRSDAVATGEQLHELISELYPICRSLTGNGVRATLEIIRKRIPLQVHEVPTGTQIFDWTAPKEWNIRDAYVKNASGERVIDFQRSNLHVMGYSVPVHTRLSLQELKPRLYSLPDRPDWVPYRASFFKPDWGFSIAHCDLLALPEGEYEVCIDSTLEDGHLTFGECFIPGASADEVLVSTHICHPSLANDNLSGIAVAAYLARALQTQANARRYSYRFVFVPSQIGSLAWLARNERSIHRVKHGVVLVALGYAGSPTYKRSRRGAAEIDRVFEHALKTSGGPYDVIDFYPHGNDERQYCSPGFNLPVGSFMRTPCGKFPEYHTSADDLRCVQPRYLKESLDVCLQVFSILEGNRTYRNLNPKGEPQLGRRGLYRQTSDLSGAGKVKELPILWVLNLSDGAHSLLDIAERSGYSFADVRQAADDLIACNLLEEQASPTS